MKIGIVTIFNVGNYGAMLQCYSLCKFLESNGHQPVLLRIPFPADPNKKPWLTFDFISKKFSIDFVKRYLPYTNDLSTEVDVYLVGSDQVWNPDIVGANWRDFMLDFAPENKPKISYGSSFGVKSWKRTDLKKEAQKLLSRFDCISVREASGVDLLRDEFGIESKHVLDPCFLNENFNEFISADLTSKNTLVSFLLLPYRNPWSQGSSDLAKALNCEYINNSKDWRFPIKLGMKGLNIKYLPVHKWILNIARSSYVITDSFHGMVVSIMYKKQFAVIDNGHGRFTRLSELLQTLNLSNRVAKDFNEAYNILKTPIDYSHVMTQLYSSQEMSRDYLLNSLREINRPR